MTRRRITTRPEPLFPHPTVVRAWAPAAGNQWELLASYCSFREWRDLEQSCLRMEPYKPSATARSGIIGPERLLGIASQTRMCRNLTAILRCIGSIPYMTVRHVVRPVRSLPCVAECPRTITYTILPLWSLDRKGTRLQS